MGARQGGEPKERVILESLLTVEGEHKCGS